MRCKAGVVYFLVDLGGLLGSPHALGPTLLVLRLLPVQLLDDGFRILA